VRAQLRRAARARRADAARRTGVDRGLAAVRVGGVATRMREESMWRVRLFDVAVRAAAVAAASAAGAAGGATAPGTAGDGASPPAHHAQIGAFGLASSGAEPSVKPGDDFERYANGHWDDTAQIPPDRASWGSFAQLRERPLQQLPDILEGLPAQAPAGSNRQKLGDFYRAYLDSDAIEKAGLAPA